jgi:invasion protein IalB
LLAAAQPGGAAEPPKVIEQIESWSIACAPATAGKVRCELVQEMIKRETGQRVFRLSFRLNDAGAVELVAMAPFGVLLRPGVTFTVDAGQPFAGEFIACFSEGCLSRFVVPDDVLGELDRGTALSGVMQVYEADSFRVQFALAGFGKGVARLRELAQP